MWRQKRTLPAYLVGVSGVLAILNGIAWWWDPLAHGLAVFSASAKSKSQHTSPKKIQHLVDSRASGQSFPDPLDELQRASICRILSDSGVSTATTQLFLLNIVRGRVTQTPRLKLDGSEISTNDAAGPPTVKSRGTPWTIRTLHDGTVFA